MKNLTFIFILISFFSFAQEDSVSIQQQNPPSLNPVKFKYSALIIPSTLVGYGIVGLESDDIKRWNAGIKEEVNEHIDTRFTIDDISQYAPFVSVYGLNAMGIKGKHNFKDRTIILGTAYLIMGGTVSVLKKTTGVWRPDHSSQNSFPSGHTATAFMGAEFLFQEYKDVSIWYGVAGYAIATGTGFFRVYNDRHWVTDVAAGAGIGILSTKIAYWTFPWIKEHIFKDKPNLSGSIAPIYNGEQMGLGMVINF